MKPERHHSEAHAIGERGDFTTKSPRQEALPPDSLAHAERVPVAPRQSVKRISLLVLACAACHASRGADTPAAQGEHVEAKIAEDELCTVVQPPRFDPALQSAVVHRVSLACAEAIVPQSMAQGDRDAYLGILEASASPPRKVGAWLLVLKDDDASQRLLSPAREHVHVAVDAENRPHTLLTPYDGYADRLRHDVHGAKEEWALPSVEGNVVSVTAGQNGSVAAVSRGPRAIAIGLFDGERWSTRTLPEQRYSGQAAFDHDGSLWVANNQTLLHLAEATPLPQDESLVAFAPAGGRPVVLAQRNDGLRVRWLATGADALVPRPPEKEVTRIEEKSTRTVAAEDVGTWLGEAAGELWVVVERRIDDLDVKTEPFCMPSDGIAGRSPPSRHCQDQPKQTASRSRREALIYRASNGALSLAASVPLGPSERGRLGERLFVSSRGPLLSLAWGTMDSRVHYVAFDARKLRGSQ